MGTPFLTLIPSLKPSSKVTVAFLRLAGRALSWPRCSHVSLTDTTSLILHETDIPPNIPAAEREYIERTRTTENRLRSGRSRVSPAGASPGSPRQTSPQRHTQRPAGQSRSVNTLVEPRPPTPQPARRHPTFTLPQHDSQPAAIESRHNGGTGNGEYRQQASLPVGPLGNYQVFLRQQCVSIRTELMRHTQAASDAAPGGAPGPNHPRNDSQTGGGRGGQSARWNRAAILTTNELQSVSRKDKLASLSPGIRELAEKMKLACHLD